MWYVVIFPTLLGIVGSSDLVTFASWSTIRHSALHVALQPLAGSPLKWRRKLGATYRDGGYFPSAARKVIDLLRDIAQRRIAVAVTGGRHRLPVDRLP